MGGRIIYEISNTFLKFVTSSLNIGYLFIRWDSSVGTNYLVTGGAGFLGINLIRFLLEKGHSAASLDLANFDYPDVIKDVNIIKGDIRDRTIVDRCMKGIDIVVHTAAALPLYKKADIFSTDIDGTRNIVDSAFQHGVERVIHISSTAVYGIPDHHPLLETDRLDGVGPYGRAKIKAEEVCLEYRHKGMCIPGRNLLSGRSDWECLRFFTTGPRMVRIFR